MTPTQLQQRIELAREAMLASIELATAARDQFQPHTEHWSAVNGLVAQAEGALNRAVVCAEALMVYAPPEFYVELPPSRALDDEGQYARNKLAQAFPE